MRLLGLAALLALSACSTYRDELARSQRAFEQNEHERALAMLRGLEADTSHLSVGERARYAYLRGMTDYRVGYKADAHHWLAIARALDVASPGSLPSDWRPRLDEAMGDLTSQVATGGFESLGTAKRPGSGEADAKKAKPRDPESSDDTDDVKPLPAKPKPKKPVDEDE